MTCSGCSGAVTRILSKKSEVDSFDVSLETQLVRVKSETLSQEEIFEIIKKSGKATEIVN
jgi:copper chaperone